MKNGVRDNVSHRVERRRVVRVTSSVCPADTMRSAIAAICEGVFPKPSTTSGKPCRIWR